MSKITKNYLNAARKASEELDASADNSLERARMQDKLARNSRLPLVHRMEMRKQANALRTDVRRLRTTARGIKALLENYG